MKEAGDVSQLVGCLLSRHESLSLIPITIQNQVWCWLPLVPVLRRWKWEDQKPKVILDYK